MIDDQALHDVLVEGIAQFEQATTEDVEEAIAASGGPLMFELESRMAEWIVAYAEQVLALSDLPKPSDLHRAQFATLGALGTAIADSLNGG
ncbi:hypothetical protein ACWEKT_21050 [Nocardia takedensis]